MKKARNGLMNTLPYICLVGVIALGLMTIVGTGGGGGGTTTPAPAPSGEEPFAASASIGELLTYSIDLEDMPYSCEIIESEYGYEGQTVSGTLVKNVDGTYSPSDNPNAMIMHLNEFIVGGVEIGGNDVLFAGVPKIAGNYTASEIAGVYNYASFECDDAPVAGQCLRKAFLGTFEVNADGTIRICTSGNILDNDSSKCQYGIVEETWTDNGNSTISATVGGVEIAKAMFLPDTGDSKIMIGDTKESGDPDGTHPGIFKRGHPLKGRSRKKTPLLAKKSSFFAWPQRPHQHGLVLASFFAPVTSVSLVLVKN